MGISFINLSILVAIYMFFQYLAVPLIMIFGEKGVSSRYFIVVGAGLLSYLAGIIISHFIFKYLTKDKYLIKIKTKIDHDVRVLYYSGIIFLSLGILLKLKSCHFIESQLDCNQYFERIMKPNYLYISAITCFLAGLLIDLKIKFRVTYIFYIILLISATLAINVLSGGGRTLLMALFLSLAIGVFSLFPKVRRLKFLTLLGLLILIIWVFISYIKEISYPSAGMIPHFDIHFMTVKVINRISHSHILDSILNSWPSDLRLFFLGWQDFFSLPSFNFNRTYLSGNDFGRAFKIISPEDFVTGIAPTYIGDLYMRGGVVLGVMLGMFFIGLLYKGFDFLLLLLPIDIALSLSMILIPLMLHGVEDFVFLTLSTNFLMLSFYLTVFFGVSYSLQKSR
jgi:hypothetical protein